jgi:hypothetical protein
VRFEIVARQQPDQVDVEVRADPRAADARPLLPLRLGLAGGEIKALRRWLEMFHRYSLHLPVEFQHKSDEIVRYK